MCRSVGRVTTLLTRELIHVTLVVVGGTVMDFVAGVFAGLLFVFFSKFMARPVKFVFLGFFF